MTDPIQSIIKRGYEARTKEPRAPNPYDQRTQPLEWYSWHIGAHRAWQERQGIEATDQGEDA